MSEPRNCSPEELEEQAKEYCCPEGEESAKPEGEQAADQKPAKKRGRPKKADAAPAPTPEELEKQILEKLEAEAAAQVDQTSPEIEAEEALRKKLMGVDFTKEDFQNSPNYLVEAGAGAGKTTIMVERIVNQLVSGFCKPEELVAITFTNKSTLEMRERLDKLLQKRLKELQTKAAGGETLTGEEQARLERLETVVQESGRMQVSTIHSFCQTMLESMPFSSPLGLDMQVMDDDEELAKAFLKRKWREKQRPFDSSLRMGVKYFLLEQAYLDCCKSGYTAGYSDVSSPEVKQWEQDVRSGLHSLQQELNALTVDVPELREELREIMTMTPGAFAADEDANRSLFWLCLDEPEHFPLDWGIKDADDKAKIWSGVDGMAVDQVWLSQSAIHLRNSARLLVHSYVMRDAAALAEEYRREKLERHIATYDDLLRHTRDMLRDKPEARAFFHNRYKAVYVDEMQDTDPVQTELLFYLTTAEEAFDGTNWKNCRSVPGSLFLVGDPKQAIYRFRGADIGVYNDLLELFRSREDNGGKPVTAGEKVTLHFNFRSSSEICALADRIFAPDAADPDDVQFVGGKYHAEYASMLARNGSCPRARTLYCGKGHDVKRVAAFIYKMIENRQYVGIHRPKYGRNAHPAQPEDFLILTQEKSQVQKFEQALQELGIPVEGTGKKFFRNTEPIARAVLHLQSLLAPRDDQKLLLVLRTCYGIKDAEVLTFLQRTGSFSLTGAVRKENLEKVQRGLAEEILKRKQELDQTQDQVKKLALENEKQQLEKLLQVCTALEEIAELRKLSRTQPAMAVIERLLEGGYGVWDGQEVMNLIQRRQAVSAVQQYLNLVRGSKEHSFTALAAYAVACADKEFEHALPLESSGGAVRVMNLHKAKGLEAEIVILAFSIRKKKTFTSYVEQRGGTATEYRLLRGNSYSTIGEPVNWDTYHEEEARHNAAEYARLLYVAATRAKTMLIVCGKDGEEDKNYWRPLRKGLQESGESDVPYGATLKVLERMPNGFQKSVREKLKPAQPAAQVAVDPSAMEGAIQESAAALAESGFYAITPSQLNHHARGVINKRDEEEPETTNTTAVAKLVDHSEAEEESEAPRKAAPEPAEAATPGPYGPDWGTIVHRIMELAVRENCFTEQALETFARRAVTEQLPDGLVNAAQRRMLRLEGAETGAEVIDRLTGQAAQAAAFVTQEDCKLRRLLTGGEGYPELPFFLQAGEDSGELYRHLTAYATSEQAQGRTLAVEGVIDLAVRKDDAWYVVDYKTDKQRSGESEEKFIQRLKDEYTPQITAYARVLERMNMGRTKKAWLCSIPLKGDFIELDIAPKKEDAVKTAD